MDIGALIQAGSGIVKDVGFTNWGMDFNRDESKKSRDFNYMMATKKYQLAVNDMRAAGLNPMLMASGGFSPGNAQSGGFASAPLSNTTDVSEAYNRTTKTKQDIIQSDALTKQAQALIGQIEKNATLLDEKAQTERMSRDLMASQITQNEANASLTGQMFWKSVIDADLASQKIETEKALAEMYRSNAKFTGNKTDLTQPLANFLNSMSAPSAASQLGNRVKNDAPILMDQLLDALYNTPGVIKHKLKFPEPTNPNYRKHK